MQLKIDFRERERVKSAEEYYKSQGVEVEVCELEVGDYLFNNKVCVEFKTVNDFISSIQDNRVFNQCVAMAENYDYCFVLIFGDGAQKAKALAMSRNYRPVTLYQYIGAICSLNRYVTVIQVDSPFINQSYYTMMTQAKKCLQDKPIVKKFPKKHKNPVFSWLTYCNYGINAKKAQAIVDTLNLNTLQDLFNLNVETLTSVDGIGKKTAENILRGIKL